MQYHLNLLIKRNIITSYLMFDFGTFCDMYILFTIARTIEHRVGCVC